ncbi:MAG: ATP-binding protein, partial [Cytophagales bacterium]|nr:ATP-binding protein [Cytophagales bacterium]
LEISQSLCNILGIRKPKDLVGTNLSELFTNSREFEAVQTYYQQYDDRVYKAEVYWRKRTNDVVKLRLLISPRMKNNGNFLGFLGTGHDIERDEKAQRYARRHENLEKTYRLTRSLAHEIRNPLTTIDLAVDGLKDTITEHDDDFEYLQIIDRSSKRVNLLLNELLSSSKSDGLELAVYPLNEFLMDTVKLVKDRAELSDIEIETELQTDEALMCRMDYSKLQIAVVNILTNAIEALIGKQGKIQVLSKRLNGEVIIYIIDNGGGIAPDEQELLFDPFYSSKKSGVGLGLTMSQSIVKEHHGHIDLESTSGEGSNFTIKLPVFKDEL